MKYKIYITDKRGAKLAGTLDLQLTAPGVKHQPQLEAFELDWVYGIEAAINVKTALHAFIHLIEGPA